MKHVKLTANVQVKWGRTLYQIEAAIDFGAIKKGTLGGWVESIDCIASDEAWLFPDVMADCDARFYRGVFWGGEFRGGEFRGGEFRGGVFWGGVFWGGVFRGGVFWGGEFWGGVFWGGEFRGGVFWGGEFWGGVFWGGEFRGGVFWGGVFKKTSDYIAFCSIGSEGGVLTAYLQAGVIRCTRGCFNGSLTDFKKAVTTKHKSSVIAKEYKMAIGMIEARFKIKKTKA